MSSASEDVAQHLRGLAGTEPGLCEIVAADLERLASISGDGRFGSAAAVLRGRRGGRPDYDDTAAIAEVRWLVLAGKAKSISQACDLVARTMKAGASHAAIAARLRRKERSSRLTVSNDTTC